MSLVDLIRQYDVELSDPRTSDKFLTRNPLIIITILILYALIVLKWGPKYMEKRQPYSLKAILLCYNVFQILSNAYLVHMMYTAGWSTEYTLGCEPVPKTTRPIDMKMLNAVYLTLLLKIFDLTETIMFIMRKKSNQVTYLHVYHHISTVIVSYLCYKYFPGGMMSMLMIVNGSVHVIMYTYYLLASLSLYSIINPIKHYITRIQIIQFLFLMWHQSQGFLASCSVPKFAPIMNVSNLIINLILFLNFYKNQYFKHLKKA